MSPPLPSRDLIESKAIVEGPCYDFKAEVDLETLAGKIKLLNDVVAFLNSRAGHLIVGVRERRGAYEAFAPIKTDPHKLGERIQSVLQDNIDPVPLRIEVHAIDVDGGHLLDIRIPEHRLRPYQNKLTGGFYVRTDKQNRPIPRDEVFSHFKQFEDFLLDMQRLKRETADDLARREIMLEDGPILTISILPREHYDNHPPFEGRRGMVVSLGPCFPHSSAHGVTYRACAGGMEANAMAGNDKSLSRLFISDAWFVQATVAHPFRREPDDRVGIHEMRSKLSSFLEDIAAVIEGADVRGPFCVELEISHLKRSDRVAWVFHTDGPVRFAPRGLIERLDPVALADGAFQAVVRASTYG